MFDVLVYVYENYWRGDACPEIQHLGRKLSAAGFDQEEIDQALQWLEGLQQASHDTQLIDISEPAPEPARQGRRARRQARQQHGAARAGPLLGRLSGVP